MLRRRVPDRIEIVEKGPERRIVAAGDCVQGVQAAAQAVPVS